MAPIREFIGSGPPLHKKDLDELEQKLDAKLPAAYRKFLLSHNGGQPDPPYFLHNVMSRFYSLKVKERTDSLLANRKRMSKRLPPEVIPIAGDEFGNEICLAIKGKNRGKLYLWDHEGRPEPVDVAARYPEIIFNAYSENEPTPRKKPDWPGYPDLVLIADNFDTLLDSFHDVEEART